MKSQHTPTITQTWRFIIGNKFKFLCDFSIEVFFVVELFLLIACFESGSDFEYDNEI